MVIRDVKHNPNVRTYVHSSVSTYVPACCGNAVDPRDLGPFEKEEARVEENELAPVRTDMVCAVMLCTIWRVRVCWCWGDGMSR